MIYWHSPQLQDALEIAHRTIEKWAGPPARGRAPSVSDDEFKVACALIRLHNEHRQSSAPSEVPGWAGDRGQ